MLKTACSVAKIRKIAVAVQALAKECAQDKIQTEIQNLSKRIYNPKRDVRKKFDLNRN